MYVSFCYLYQFSISWFSQVAANLAAMLVSGFLHGVGGLGFPIEQCPYLNLTQRSEDLLFLLKPTQLNELRQQFFIVGPLQKGLQAAQVRVNRYGLIPSPGSLQLPDS